MAFVLSFADKALINHHNRAAMVDPGTCLAIVSLALQMTQGLLGYYEL